MGLRFSVQLTFAANIAIILPTEKNFKEESQIAVSPARAHLDKCSFSPFARKTRNSIYNKRHILPTVGLSAMAGCTCSNCNPIQDSKESVCHPISGEKARCL